MKIMENAGHINAASGFGKLDCALDWIKELMSAKSMKSYTDDIVYRKFL